MGDGHEDSAGLHFLADAFQGLFGGQQMIQHMNHYHQRQRLIGDFLVVHHLGGQSMASPLQNMPKLGVDGLIRLKEPEMRKIAFFHAKIRKKTDVRTQLHKIPGQGRALLQNSEITFLSLLQAIHRHPGGVIGHLLVKLSQLGNVQVILAEKKLAGGTTVIGEKIFSLKNPLQ